MRRLRQWVICAASIMLVACGGQDNAASGDNMALELRNMILSSEPEASDTDKNPSVVIMDIHVDDGMASVMSSSAGDASVYLSSGRSMIGGVAHENVRMAAVAFATEAVKHKAAMSVASSFPYPAAGQVRFYLRTREGAFVAEAPESELVAGKHQLSGLFEAGQEVVTRFRAVEGARK